MGVALKDLRGKVKRPIRSVTICLDGDLWSQHDDLTRELDEIRGRGVGRMGQTGEAVEIAQKLADVEKAMRDSSVKIEFRGISSFQLSEIQARFPSEDKRMAWDVDAGAAALIAACAVEPTTEAEARELLDELNQKVASELVGAAWLATAGSSEVPFSVRASELLHASA